MSKILQALKTAFKDPRIRKVFSETADGAPGSSAWSNDNFRVDRGTALGRRVLQVNKQTQVSALVAWVRKQGAKGTHTPLATFDVEEKAEAEVTAEDIQKLYDIVANKVKENT